MNRFFKGFILVTLIFMGLALFAGLFIFYKLPSARSLITQGSEPKKGSAVSRDAVKKEVNSKTVPAEAKSTPDSLLETAPVKSQITKKTIEELTSAKQPLSDFCKSLAKAKAGPIPESEFSSAFDSVQVDPRIEAAKPLIRYVFRLPKMQNLVTELTQAAERNDESLVEKAQFYSSAYAAFTDMKEHQADIESVLDRSYLFLGLNNLVAKKPELLNDLRVQNFCDATEQLFNEGSPVDFQSEKNHFLSLLQDSGVKPSEINFNPDYKSNILFNFDGKALTFTGGWLDDLVTPSELER